MAPFPRPVTGPQDAGLLLEQIGRLDALIKAHIAEGCQRVIHAFGGSACDDPAVSRRPERASAADDLGRS